MHHALEIQEILLNVFVHCRPSLLSRRRVASDLLALATTCRAFKEPALDVLWEELDNLSPLARCLLGMSQELVDGENQREESHDLLSLKKYSYSFSKPLSQTEWDILRSYTRRIRSIFDLQSGLDGQSIKTLWDHPEDTEPLFPNLRYVRCECTTETMPLLCLPFPSLISLDLVFGDPSSFREHLGSFPKLSSNIKRLFIHLRRIEDAFLRIELNKVCHWQNLWSLDCPQVNLDTDTLMHLARMPALTRLAFRLIVTLPVSDSPLCFPHLRMLKLYSAPLDSISRLLSQTQLPAMTLFTAVISSCPSRKDLSLFFAGFQTSSAGHAIESLTIDQTVPSMNAARDQNTLLLDLEDLRPCIAFSSLRCLKLNIEWNVGLTDNDLLTLAAAWPHLERLVINAYSGWNTPRGITPNGLLRLLQAARSLRWITVAIDTREYTTLPSSRWLGSLGLALPRTFCINVLDSAIEAASVPAIAAFFTGLAPYSNFSFSAWQGGKMVKHQNWEVYKSRWDNIFRWANSHSSFLNHFGRQRSLTLTQQNLPES